MAERLNPSGIDLNHPFEGLPYEVNPDDIEDRLQEWLMAIQDKWGPTLELRELIALHCTMGL